MTGFVKIHRKLLISDSWQSLTPEQQVVMIVCLLLANHTTKKWTWAGKVFICKPGQFVTSLDTLKKHCGRGISIQNIRTALDKLKTWDFLTDESTKQGRLITIRKWSEYQDDINKRTNGHLTNDQQTINKQTNRQLTSTKNKRRKEALMETNSEKFSKKINSEEFENSDALPPEVNPRFQTHAVDVEYRLAYTNNAITPELETRYQESLKQRGL